MAAFLDNNNAIVPLAIGLGATLFLNPADWLQLTFSTADADATPFQPGFDTAFDSWTTLFGYLEIGLRPELLARGGTLPGNYRLGLIWDPRQKERFGETGAGPARVTRGDAGFYLSFDQMIYRERPWSAQGVGLFARYGYRDPDVNRVDHFWSIGGQYQGLLPRRDADVLGIGTYTSHVSADLRDAGYPDLHDETGFEVYYRIDVFPWLQVTPDWQFLIDPGARRSVEDALVFGLRARVTF
jgi:porin